MQLWRKVFERGARRGARRAMKGRNRNVNYFKIVLKMGFKTCPIENVWKVVIFDVFCAISIGGVLKCRWKRIFKRRFLKGAPAGCLPPRRGGASVSEHIDKCLTVNRADIIYKILNFMHFENNVWKGKIEMSQFKNGFEDGFQNLSDRDWTKK
jgi:hypothetical protein